MGNQVLAVTALTLLSGCVTKPEIPPELHGTYISNQHATLERWETDRPFGEATDRMIEAFSPILGKARMDLSENTIRIQIDDYDSEETLDFVEIEPEGIRIGYFSELYDRQLVSLIKVTEDGYWTFSDDIIPGYREKFDRSANQARDATE